MATAAQSPALRSRWEALLEDEPKLRARNAAARLDVAEGELVAARCDGETIVRLRDDYKALLESLVSLGEVLVITRNDHAVNEKRGYYSSLQLKDHGGGAFDYNINLRIFFRNWGHVFAVHENDRLSLQVFDRDGTSVHKIYRTENSDPDAWTRLLGTFRADDQTPELIPSEPNQPYKPESPELADADALCRQWREMTDLHSFWFILREHNLRRIDALRLAPHELARPVAVDAWKHTLQQVAKTGLQIMIFTRSPGVAQIHTGPIHNLVETGEWFNVLDPTFNLHLRADAVHETWVVYKPTSTGGQTSLELYDKDGQLISHIFGAVNMEAPELRSWRALMADIPTVDTALAEA